MRTLNLKLGALLWRSRKHRELRNGFLALAHGLQTLHHRSRPRFDPTLFIFTRSVGHRCVDEPGKQTVSGTFSGRPCSLPRLRCGPLRDGFDIFNRLLMEELAHLRPPPCVGGSAHGVPLVFFDTQAIFGGKSPTRSRFPAHLRQTIHEYVISARRSRSYLIREPNARFFTLSTCFFHLSCRSVPLSGIRSPHGSPVHNVYCVLFHDLCPMALPAPLDPQGRQCPARKRSCSACPRALRSRSGALL